MNLNFNSGGGEEMKQLVFLFSYLGAGFFLYFAYSGFVENELFGFVYQDRIDKKVVTEMVEDMGMNIVTKPRYEIHLSSGKIINVSHSSFDTYSEGEAVTVIRKNQKAYLFAK
jgi:hypothetical protein